MTVSRVVIFSSSGHAKVVVDVIESNPNFHLVGFIDKFKPIGEKILGYKVIGDEQSLKNLMIKYNFNRGIVGVGDNFVRSEIVKTVKRLCPPFKFVNCIHKSAKISKHCQLGVGNVVMPNVSVNAEAIISNHCILNTNSSLDHNSKMEAFSSLAPNSAVGGNSSIGKFSSVGIGASVFQGINIGKNCIIGGGSVVNKDTNPNSIYYGVPARFVSLHKLGEKYLS